KRSIVSQREVEHDTKDYQTALRAALRQAPGVILVGEMRDYETIHTALTAAETGQLVLATLHTMGAAKTIDRIIDIFPANQQQQIRIQLSMLLRATVSQQLLPTVANELYPAFEILVVNSAVQNMIRENKTHQLDNVMASSGAQGMRTMDGDIARLFAEERISRETALLYAVNPETLSRRL
ncbi:MAG: ATPase, T2SS/T4P/T4SS family, partial [Eubacteriales bacterium]|nr:ATPase, T2SS/T4P/T4SS family [Eubacteriales bacterium]